MSEFYYRPKITSEMQQRINQLSKNDRFHSHAVAKVDPTGHTIGSTAKPESFESRQQRQHNRDHIGHYKQSRIGVFGHRPGTKRSPIGARKSIQPIQPTAERQRLNSQSRPNPAATSKPPTTFREPPTRGYNPYA